MTKQFDEDELKSILADVPEVSLVYLFGSRAGGIVGPLSDYDLGVLVDRGYDTPELRARLTHEFVRRLGTERVDVVLLNHAPIELAYAVIAEGKLLYQRDVATRVEYEASVLSRYGDYLPVLRAQRRDILRGGEHAARVRRYRAALGRAERTIGQVKTTRTEDTGRV